MSHDPTSRQRSRLRSKKKNANNNGRRAPLGREGWLRAAREALVREGIGGVEIGKLARRLKVTRGGFYWFFKSRRELLDSLLNDWTRTNTEAFKAVLRDSGHNGMAEFVAVVDIWVAEKTYDPLWDAAVRDWARVSPKVADLVRRVDQERIAILQQIFLDMGCAEDEALVRARISYFHQVGYYTLRLQEPREQRLRLVPLYIRYLSGR